MTIKKKFVRIKKFYPDPEGLNDSNILCLTDTKLLEEIILLYLEEGEKSFIFSDNWLNLYLSEFSKQPITFHESYYKSILEDFIFLTLCASKIELYDLAEKLKKVRIKFIECFILMYNQLGINGLDKKTEIEQQDEKIYNFYYKLFENDDIKKIGDLETFYFEDEND